MKVYFVLLVVTASCLSSKIIPKESQLRSLLEGNIEFDELIPSFVDFAFKFNKSYANEQEMIHRLMIFKDGVAEAKRLTERARSVGSDATYGITKFSDLTREEFKNNYLMRKMPTIPKEKMYPNNLEPESSIAHLLKDPLGPPSSFDWEQQPGTETPVYNQGSCGSCWAFSATENHESRYARQHNQAANRMSVQQILDCDAPNTYGCNGGWPYQAWEYIQSQGGQDHYGCYPYVGEVQGSCNWNGGCNAGSLVSWSWIFPNHEYEMLMWLWGNAPISICVDASQWSYYTGGTVLSSECAQQTDHCVLLSGWNMNSNPSYWNVRNSWGTDWGMSGFIHLQYGANTCGMAQYAASCHTINGQ